MRPPGIEPGLVAWEATVIPLDHGRLLIFNFYSDHSFVLLDNNCYAFQISIFIIFQPHIHIN